MPSDQREHLVWGHDEVVVHEKALKSKCWHGSNGEAPLRPKDLGTSRHLSAVTNRQFGWSPEISDSQLEEINNNRRGKMYVAEDQAVQVYGSALKEDLSKDEGHFYWSMRPGANNDGYWNLAHFVIQLENLMDVCAVLFPNTEYQHVISLDHSNNHGGKRVGGLDVLAMNKGFGGTQALFEDSEITVGGCLGNLEKASPNQLDVGDTQCYVFNSNDDGPYWMTPAEREASKFDIVGEDKTRTLRKDELVVLIVDTLSPQPPPENMNKKNLLTLQTMATRLGIPIRVTEPKVTEGWMGKAKGLAQICWERRLIDEAPSKYSKNQLKKLVAECHDFKTELSLVEWVAKQYGWLVIFSPKGHPEIAGIGIEYLWAVSKTRMQGIALADRKGREKFDAAFKESFSRDFLAPRTVRGCARAARQYMEAYLLGHAEQLPPEKLTTGYTLDDLKACVQPIALKKIEKIRSACKSHRSVADVSVTLVKAIIADAAAAPE